MEKEKRKGNWRGRKKGTYTYSKNGSKKTEYYAIIQLLSEGLNQFQIHKKLGINRYSVKRVAEEWKKEEEEQNGKD